MRSPLVALALVVLTLGCVGEDADRVPSPPPSNTSDAGSATPPPPPPPPPGTPPPASARSIRCDLSGTCSGVQKCCAGADGTDWNEASCKDACDGYTITCDDAADCGAGEVCCFTTDGGARTVQSYCSASACPSTNGGQFCALGGDECGQSRTCTALTDFGPSLVASCQ